MNKIPKLPCLKDKCLLYPSCRNKRHVHCDKLFMLLENEYKKKAYKRYSKLSRYIRKTFPSIINVRHSSISYGHYIKNTTNI